MEDWRCQSLSRAQKSVDQNVNHPLMSLPGTTLGRSLRRSITCGYFPKPGNKDDQPAVARLARGQGYQVDSIQSLQVGSPRRQYIYDCCDLFWQSKQRLASEPIYPGNWTRRDIVQRLEQKNSELTVEGRNLVRKERSGWKIFLSVLIGGRIDGQQIWSWTEVLVTERRIFLTWMNAESRYSKNLINDD